MKKVREVARLFLDLKLGVRPIARACSISTSTAHVYVDRLKELNVPYEELSVMDDDALGERDGLGSSDSVGQFLSGGLPWFTLRPSPRAACSSKPHPESFRQGPDDAAICCTDQTM
jgi:hypothetical protein